MPIVSLDNLATLKPTLELILKSCLQELFTKDFILIKNNVSERAITHKLAEYIQKRIPEFDVDCEYNRNLPAGEGHAKTILVIKERSIKEIKLKYEGTVDSLIDKEEVLSEVTSYPDIIIHQRGINDKNILIIEAKKSNSQVSDEYDFIKLKAFTSLDQVYKFKYGAFIKFNIGYPYEFPSIRWFSEGKEI
jgi:hypothetical protein